MSQLNWDLSFRFNSGIVNEVSNHLIIVTSGSTSWLDLYVWLVLQLRIYSWTKWRRTGCLRNAALQSQIWWLEILNKHLVSYAVTSYAASNNYTGGLLPILTELGSNIGPNVKCSQYWRLASSFPKIITIHLSRLVSKSNSKITNRQVAHSTFGDVFRF
jgi:hypothetical protein